jgi:hypothetical protein
MAIVFIHHKKWTPYIHPATTTEEKPHCPSTTTHKIIALQTDTEKKYNGLMHTS